MKISHPVIESLVSDLNQQPPIDLDKSPPAWLEESLKKFITKADLKQLEVEKTLHFIWIGDLPDSACATIDLWRKANLDYTVNLWRVKSALLCSHVKGFLNEILSNTNQNYSIIQLQNDLFRFFLSQENSAIDFDGAIIKWLRRISPKVGEKAENVLIELKEKENALAKSFNIIYVDDDLNIFKITKKLNFLKIFEREVMLRNNLACASDILRLAVLYKFGGVYIDCDTLPCLHKLFPNSRGDYSQKARLFDAYKSQIVLEDLQNLKPKIADKTLAPILASLDEEWLTKIQEDRNFVDKRQVPAGLGGLKVYKDSIRLSSDRNVEGDFNNNMIATHRGSRLIKIMLREVAKRYRYLSRNGLIDGSLTRKVFPDPYYNRLDAYRNDGEGGKDHFVTLHLTGPILILEVLLGVCYEVFKLDSLDQKLLSYLLYQPIVGVSLPNQTMYSLQHLESSWM